MLLLNISDFSLFFVKTASPSEKCHPLFPSKSPLKIEDLSSPPLFWKFRRFTPCPQQKRMGVHTMWMVLLGINKVISCNKHFGNYIRVLGMAKNSVINMVFPIWLMVDLPSLCLPNTWVAKCKNSKIKI